MNLNFNDTRPANASVATLFEVVTDYPAYPSSNSAVTNVRVVRKDDSGAEFVADRKTRIGKRVRAYDRYERHGDVALERTYEARPRPVPPGPSIPWTPPTPPSPSTRPRPRGQCKAW